jgi:antitoxin MazE
VNVLVGKWGNSLAIRIPATTAKELGLHDGSELDLHQESGNLVLRPVVEEEIVYSLEELVAQITPESVHEETDWGVPEGKEVW